MIATSVAILTISISEEGLDVCTLWGHVSICNKIAIGTRNNHKGKHATRYQAVGDTSPELGASPIPKKEPVPGNAMPWGP